MAVQQLTWSFCLYLISGLGIASASDREIVPPSCNNSVVAALVDENKHSWFMVNDVFCWPISRKSWLYRKQPLIEGVLAQITLEGRAIDPIHDLEPFGKDANAVYMELLDHGHMFEASRGLVPKHRPCCGSWPWPLSSHSRFFMFQPLMNIVMLNAFDKDWDSETVQSNLRFLVDPQDRLDLMQEAFDNGWFANTFGKNYVKGPPILQRLCHTHASTTTTTTPAATCIQAFQAFFVQARESMGLRGIPFLVILFGMVVMYGVCCPKDVPIGGMSKNIADRVIGRLDVLDRFIGKLGHLDRIVSKLNSVNSQMRRAVPEQVGDAIPEQIGHAVPEQIGNAVLQQWPMCFQRDNTAAKRENGDFVRMDMLQKGDAVRSQDGRITRVIRAPVVWRSGDKFHFVEIKTEQAKLKVTADHRFLVAAQKGSEEAQMPCLAGKLKINDCIFVGSRQRKITKITHTSERLDVVQICFFPDIPVEAFAIPDFGISAYGSPYALSEISPNDLFDMFSNVSTGDLLQAQQVAAFNGDELP